MFTNECLLYEQLLLSLKRSSPSLPHGSALQTQSLCYGLPLNLVQILYQDALERCLCCTTVVALGQAEYMADGLGTIGAVCS